MENPRLMHWMLTMIFAGVVLSAVAVTIMTGTLWPLAVPVLLLLGVFLAGLIQAGVMVILVLPFAAAARLFRRRERKAPHTDPRTR